MKNYRVCIIGCGVICPNHIRGIQDNENTELCAVCDIVEERAKKRADAAGCRYYTDYIEMLEQEKPDAVHLCLPHALHAPFAIELLERGYDVLCEKPMDVSHETAQAMKAASERSGARLGIIFQNRYNPENLAILQALQSGETGAVKFLRGEVCWHRNDAYYASGEWRSAYKTAGGGVIINQAIHTLDLIRYFAGAPVESVRATVSHHGDTAAEVEDTAEGVIRFENGARGLFYFTINNDCDEAIRLNIRCENARIDSCAGSCTITYNDGRVVTANNADGPQFCGEKKCYGSSHTTQIYDFYHDPDGSRARWMMEEALLTQKLVDDIFKASGRF
ncbi:MAG: Gfo/Idh/MocA family oxidoreductase [Clostridia bacterium]|nr:Gfo/Idh/MocA family oxidoreductase [Clostridia bacterium]